MKITHLAREAWGAKSTNKQMRGEKEQLMLFFLFSDLFFLFLCLHLPKNKILMEALDSICCASSHQRAPAVTEACTKEFKPFFQVCAVCLNTVQKKITFWNPKGIFTPLCSSHPHKRARQGKCSKKKHLFIFYKDSQQGMSSVFWNRHGRTSFFQC